MARKKGKKTAPPNKYYYIPLTAEEKTWFTPDASMNEIIGRCTILINTKRPESTQIDYFLFIVQEFIQIENYFFCFIIPAKRSLKGKGTTFGFKESPYVNQVFLQDIKKYPLFTFSEQDANTILDMGLRKKLDESRHHVLHILRETLMEQTKQTERKYQPAPLSYFYKDTIQSYVNDLNKPITRQHSQLKEQIQENRNKYISKYVSNPLLELKNVSRKNRPSIQRYRKQHEKTLLQRYGNSVEKIPQQLHQQYRKKIIQKRQEQEKKRQQKQRQTMRQQDLLIKVKPMIQNYIKNYQDNPKQMVEQVVWTQLGLIDPIRYTRITKPVILPKKTIEDPENPPPKTIVDQQSIPDVLKYKMDPMTRQSLPQNIEYNVNQPISKIIKSVEKQTNQIMSSDLPMKTKVLKLIQLRHEYEPKVVQERKK